MRSIARTVDPPVVTTSSTTRQGVPRASGGPSIQRCNPCSLRALRTKKATQAPACPEPNPAQASGSGATLLQPPAAAPRPPAPAAIRAHRHSADGCRPALRRLGGDQLSSGAVRGGAQQGALGIDVVLGLPPAGEGDLADHQRVLTQLPEQALPGPHPRASRKPSRQLV